MFQIFVDNEEVLCESSFEIKEEFMNPSSIELYKVYPKKWKGTNKLLEKYYFPKDYSKCKILKDGELYFVGVIKNSADMELNPFKPHYCSLQVLSRDIFLSEGNILEFVIANKTVEEAILQVISAISDYGFVAGNINIPEIENITIGAYSTLEKAPYDVFQYLSLISSTRWGTRTINEDTVAIDFFSPELLENQGVIEYSQNYFKNNQITEFTYDFSTSDYRNKQIITSDEVYASIKQSQIFIANGYDDIYLTEQKIGKIISIKVNGITKLSATKDEKEIGIVADFYYAISDSQFVSNEILNRGTTITIEYFPIVKGREIAIDDSEINRIRTLVNRNGTISRYENRNDVTSSSELQTIGKTYIKYKGKPEITLNITSKKDFLKLGGKYIFNAPIDELNSSYLVKTKQTKIIYNSSVKLITYIYELTNTFDLENDINYFDNQRAKMNGNISQGEYISRNIDIENTANIVFSNLKIEEIIIKEDSVLESPLELSL